MCRRKRIEEFVLKELNRSPPTTQEDACHMAARAVIHVGDIPQSDHEFIEASAGLAAGLFGSAFQSATDGQKAVWMMMCEEALRQELRSPVSRA